MRNSGYSKGNDRIRELYISGNTAIEIETGKEEKESARRRRIIQEQRVEGLKIQKQQRAEKKARALRSAVIVSASAVVLGILVLLLSSVITYNSLTSEIESLTEELDTLTLQNDSVEYDIDSSVDLSYIIETATEELGMVRSSYSQVVTYSDSDSEYVNQIAEIPTE